MSIGAPSLRFTARPFVCGALGRPDPVVLGRLRDAVPGLVTIHERQDAILLSSRACEPYRSDIAVRAWSFGDRPPVSAADWQAAAVDAEAPGLAELGDRVVLHAGAHGLVDMFHRRIGETHWFASRMEPLYRLEPGPLDIDWEDWACRFVLAVPLADRTPVRQVRRLDGATALVLDRASGRVRPERWRPPWVGLPGASRDVDGVGDLLDALRSVIRHRVDGPVTLPLSGGYDSRLLALVLRDAGMPMTAVGTTKDEGRDETSIARDVASALGFPFEAIEQQSVGYAASAEATLARLEYALPMHPWAGRFAASVRAKGHLVVDGAGLGVILHDTLVSQEAAHTSDRATWQRLLFERTARLHLYRWALRAHAAEWSIEVAWDAWRAAVAHLEGDANERILAALATRTVRGPAQLAAWLYGPEVPSISPGLEPDVMRAALNVTVDAKAGGAFHRAAQAALDPRVAAIRSTHDPQDGLQPGQTARTSPEGLAWLRSHVPSREVVPGLIHRRLPLILETGDPAAGVTSVKAADRFAPEVRSPAARLNQVAVQVLPMAVLGAWLEHHGALVRSTVPPWADGPPHVRRALRSFVGGLRRSVRAP